MIRNEPRVRDDERTVAYYIAAAAALEGLPLEPAWRPSVAAHFMALLAAARRVEAAPLDERVEAAAIFEP